MLKVSCEVASCDRSFCLRSRALRLIMKESNKQYEKERLETADVISPLVWEDAMIEQFLALDGAVLLWIQEYVRADWLTPAVKTVTKFGNLGFIWIVLCLGLLCFKKTRKAGAAGLLALVFSLILNNLLLKRLVARIRPYEVIAGLELLVKPATDFSFPSGHSASSFAAATAVVRTQKTSKWRFLFLIGAVCMALSRLYIGIHYPSDVICGSISGICCGYAASIVMEKTCEFIRKRQKDETGKED